MGPTVASSEGRSSYGDELRVRAGAGSSDGTDLTTFDVGANVRATKRTQAATADLGPTFAHWFGPALLSFGPATGFGFERYAGKLFFDPVLHGVLSGGVVLDESATRARSSPFVLEAPINGFEPGVGSLGSPGRYLRVRRRRTVLTLELRGGVEPRFTRDPLWTAGVLVGLSFVSESFTLPLPSPRR